MLLAAAICTKQGKGESVGCVVLQMTVLQISSSHTQHVFGDFQRLLSWLLHKATPNQLLVSHPPLFSARINFSALPIGINNMAHAQITFDMT